MRTQKLAISLLAGLLVSCAANSQETGNLRALQADLEQLRAERDILKAKVKGMWEDFEQERRQWLDRNLELRSKLHTRQENDREKRILQSRYDSLKSQYKRLERWASDLAKGYGPGIWVYSDDHQWPLYGRKPRDASVRGIVDELNEPRRQAGAPLLVLQGVEEGVVRIGVDNALKLTTQMGSAGANSYIMTTVYSLASLPEVECVHFEFEEGDHAAPGRYCN